MVKDALFQTLEDAIKSMDIPFHRRSQNTIDNIRWLHKNLGKRNKSHKDYVKAMHIINNILSEYK